MQYSIAVTDIFVWVPAIYGTLFNLKSKKEGLFLCSIGFFLIFMAGALGTIRYAFVGDSISSLHFFFSKAAGQAGLPLIAWTFFKHYKKQSFSLIEKILPFILIGLFITFTYSFPLQIYGIIIGAIANLVIIYIGFKSRAYLQVLGALLIIIAGLAIGTKGKMFGVLRVDIFHIIFGMALSLIIIDQKKVINLNRP